MPSLRIGLISDTHGLLRPQALEALRDVDRILHAGDIGKPEILEQLARIAPVVAVRGNNDDAPWAKDIPERSIVDAGGLRVLILHDLKEWKEDAAQAGFAVVVTGHSHKPLVTKRDCVLYVNPGSAGPRRFKLPVSVGILEIADGAANARIELLEV